MPAVNEWRKPVVVVATAVLLSLTPSLAYAGGGGPLGNRGSGQSNPTGPGGPSVSASVGVQYDKSRNGDGPSAGSVTPAGNWTPPACWYQPAYTPAGMKASSEAVWAEDSPSQEWKNGQRDHYVKGKPYKNFNLDKAGKGYFWAGYSPASNGGMPGANSCNDEPFWVDKGKAAPAGHKNAVTPEILAELAYAQILIPQGKATTSPKAAQTVNLPTWVWLDGAQFHPVSVTAYLPDYGISATTTATPVSMHIDPGTSDATLFPGSGDCPMNSDGSIGTPYTTGSDGAPPCGVTYLHSTTETGQPYQLTATVTWHISWTGTGQAVPKDLPTGTFGTPQDVTVQEIQAVNR
jgi:enoyl reductase